MKYILIITLMATSVLSSTYKFDGAQISLKKSYKVVDIRRAVDREKKEELIENGYICKLKVQTRYLCSKKIETTEIPKKIKMKILKKYKGSTISFGEKYQDDELVSDAPALKEFNIFRRIEFTKGEEKIVDAEMFKLFRLKDCLEKINAKDNATAKEFWANIRKKKISRSELYSIATEDGYDKYAIDIKFKKMK